MQQRLTIVVLGASGDLAKKKTYPSLFELFRHNLLPAHTTICGFARSASTDDEFRAKLTTQSLPKNAPPQLLSAFLGRCFYRRGAYGSDESFGSLAAEATEWEAAQMQGDAVANRLYYFATPPDVFLTNAAAIKVAETAGSVV